MTLFKKQPVQGNFILSNGVQILFDALGYYETESEYEIESLSPVYEIVTEKQLAEKPKAPVIAKTGTISSASLAALAK